MLINHFLINKEWYLVDLPGYGYASRGKKQVEKIQQIIEDYILEREQMTNLFVLIDCRLEPQKIDLEFMEWLGENGVPFSIIFTKADKLTNGKVKDNVNKYLKKLTEQWEELLLISYPPLKRKQADRRFWIILTALTSRLRHSVKLPSDDYLECK